MAEILPPGWYSDNSGKQKYWTGTEWIEPAPRDISTNVDSSKQDILTGSLDFTTQHNSATKVRSSLGPHDPESHCSEVVNGAPEMKYSFDLVPLQSQKSSRSRVSQLLTRAVVAVVAILISAAFGIGIWYVTNSYQAQKAQEAIERQETKDTERKEAIEAAEVQETEEKKEKEAEEKQALIDAALKAQSDKTKNAEADLRAKGQEMDRLLTSGQTEDGEKWEVLESGNLYYRYLKNSEFNCGYFDCFGVAVFSVNGCPGGVYIEASLLLDETVVGMTNERLGSLRPDEVGTGIFDITNDYSNMHRIEKVSCYEY